MSNPFANWTLERVNEFNAKAQRLHLPPLSADKGPKTGIIARKKITEAVDLPEPIERPFAGAVETPNKTPDENHNQTSSPESQQLVRHEPVAEEAREGSNSKRIRVSVESRRRKLIDPDNLCPKYFIDCLRYAEIIPDDRAQDIELSVTQIKVEKGVQPCTVVTVERTYAEEK